MPSPRLRQIALNGNAGAFVNVVAVGGTRAIEFTEDEAAVTTGLQVQSLEDGFLTTNTFSFASEPLQIPNIGRYPNGGPLLGIPAQGQAGAFNFRAADKLISVRSNAVGGTTLRFIEND
jgi:hypothetical protein